MKSFEHNGKRVEFRAVTGTVHGHHKRGDTIIEGSGGGGSSFQGNGYTAPVQVSSRVVVKQDFFLKEDSGRDVPVQLVGVDVPLADGQRVTMISGQVGNKDHWTHVVNHDAQRYWVLGNGYELSWHWGLIRRPYLYPLIFFVVWTVVGNVVNGWVGSLTALAYMVYVGLDYARLAKAIRTHLDTLGSEALRTSNTTVSTIASAQA